MFNENDVNDYVYNMLNVSAITSLVGTNIYHREVPQNVDYNYPLIVFQNWSRFRPEYVLAYGRSHYRGSIKICSYSVDRQRDNNNIKSEIEDVILDDATTTIDSKPIIDKRIIEYVSENDIRENGKQIKVSGVILELMIGA